MTGTLDNLLNLLCSGDLTAAEDTFRRFEPYLRKVVRRNLTPELRPKFDSEDIVQSVWGTLLQGFRQAGWRFADVNHLRAFLVKATRNRFLDRVRQHSRTVGSERPLASLTLEQQPLARDPRPSQLAEAEELWQHILAVCPPHHEEIVRLKRAGLSVDEIAQRSGLHRDSVRRVLRTLAHQVAFRPTPAIPSSEVVS